MGCKFTYLCADMFAKQGHQLDVGLKFYDEVPPSLQIPWLADNMSGALFDIGSHT